MRVRGAVAPELIVTTTPRPMRLLKELIADPDTRTIVGRSDENQSNLAEDFIARLDRKYGGSRIARQERGGEMLEDVEGALFSAPVLDSARVDVAPELVRVVVSVDPAIATGRDNDATGLLALGIDASGHVYVLEDASGKMSPEAWGAAAVRLYTRHRADAFVAERNRGGDLVRANLNATIRQQNGPHATAKMSRSTRPAVSTSARSRWRRSPIKGGPHRRSAPGARGRAHLVVAEHRRAVAEPARRPRVGRVRARRNERRGRAARIPAPDSSASRGWPRA